MEKEFIIRTKSGSFYPVVVKGALLKKTELFITTKEGKKKIIAISDKSNAGPAVIDDPEMETVKEKNLVPGKVIVFGSKKEIGKTTRIAEVYKRVA